MRIQLLLVILALALSGCTSWGKYDRRRTYLHAKTIPTVKIPAGLDKPEFEDAMVIPPVNNAGDATGKPVKVGLPQTFGPANGVDKIVIKKLGDTRWVFLDAPPATVWPKVRQYFEDKHIPLASSDPSQGVMITKWLYAKGGDAKAIYQSIKNGVKESDDGVKRQEKFRIRIEPGIRSGSTEIYAKERNAPIGGPIRQDHVDWSGKSDNNALEGVILTDIAYYLGDHINTTYAVSKGAENIGGQKAMLYPDRVKPVLAFRMSFARAWATVGEALKSAGVHVADLDRSSANYYIDFDQKHPGKPGLLSRLLFHNEDKASNQPKNRFIVHLDKKKDDQVEVTILKAPDKLADADVAEQLLKMIKANST